MFEDTSLWMARREEEPMASLQPSEPGKLAVGIVLHGDSGVGHQPARTHCHHQGHLYLQRAAGRVRGHGHA